MRDQVRDSECCSATVWRRGRPIDPPPSSMFLLRRPFPPAPEPESHDPRPLQRPRGRAALAEGVGRAGIFATQQRRPAPEILRAGDVPLSVGAHPHGARAQLHDGRRARALHARQGLQRAASDGLGRVRAAGRERRDGAQGRAQGLDLREHRRDEEAAPDHGAVARLGARVRDLRPELLQASAEDVSRLPEGRARRAREAQAELGPGRHDRARQRAGDRRPRLALRRGGRAARDEPVGLQDHEVLAGTARRARHARPLARQGAADAAQLDRPLAKAC